MKCPFCDAQDTKVTDSRFTQETNSVRRRRKCDHCDRRFTTFEVISLELPMIVKNDGRREKYSRDKIKSSIDKACQKRPVPTVQIERILENIEKAVLELNEKEVSTHFIGNLVMGHLRNLDPVAYVRFASVYRTFKDVDEFVNNLKREEKGLKENSDHHEQPQ